jgi:hypothetical protein
MAISTEPTAIKQPDVRPLEDAAQAPDRDIPVHRLTIHREVVSLREPGHHQRVIESPRIET